MKFTSLTGKLTSMFKKEPNYLAGSPRFEWKFGKRSLTKLQGVNDDLVRVCHLALTLSPLDFGITCGIRTQAEQDELLAKGATQVKRSRHQDGAAIDVVAYVNGKVSWDLEHYITIAEAFALASKELDVEIRWGAAWTHSLYSHKAKRAHTSYILLRKEQGKKPFIDGPHFEVPKE